ncbi:MAG: TIGR02206 family membrane protein [Phycisphaeraceae bacterium]|nr:TIGR02206 family membrane protein [Phycisphaeraceae bacterium]
MPDLCDPFTSFGLCHALSAMSSICAAAIAITLGLRWRHTRPEIRLRHALAWGTALWQIYAVVWFILPQNFDLGTSLPLHFCDLAGLVAPAALLLRWRFLRTLLFFWGLALSSQAFIQPTLEQGPASMRFWLFWVGHLQIVGLALYDVIVLEYRPRWRDFFHIAIANTTYIGLAMALDVAITANYGYVGRSLPDQPTVLDHVGPWPWRVLWLYLAGHAIMAMIVWAFHAVQRAIAGEAPEAEARSIGAD